MEYSHFLKVMQSYQKLQKNFRELYGLGFNLYDSKYPIGEEVYSLLKTALSSHYTKEGVEWVEWFIYENDWGSRNWTASPDVDERGVHIEESNSAYGAKDRAGRLAFFSLESAWQQLEKLYKK